MNLFGVGVGASGASAAAQVKAGIADIARAVHVVGTSRRYANPPWGGVTRAPFVNAAIIVEADVPATTLLSMLFAIERRHGRVRSLKNAARTLDLDILWTSGMPTTSPTVPHPRLRQRGFAVVPLVEALDAAGLPVSLTLRAAAARQTLRPPMTVVSSSSVSSMVKA